MSKYKALVENAEKIDKDFNEARRLLLDLARKGKEPAEFQTRVEEVITNLNKETTQMSDKVESMMEYTRMREKQADSSSNVKRIQDILRQVESKAKAEGKYTPYHETLPGHLRQEQASSSYELPDEDTVIPMIKVTKAPAVEADTPREVLRSIQPPDPVSVAPISAVKSRSVKKLAQNQIPDWAMQDVAFTPGLFPGGPSVKSLTKSGSRNDKKFTTKVKHLNF